MALEGCSGLMDKSTRDSLPMERFMGLGAKCTSTVNIISECLNMENSTVRVSSKISTAASTKANG